MSVSEQITVVIPTSPIPSHPSTHIIDRAITSVRAQLSDSPIVVTADGVDQRNADYEEYLDTLRNHRTSHVGGGLITNSLHIHQSGLLTHVLSGPTPIRTALMLYYEHDWELLPDVPWAELCGLILSGKFNYIKLHAAPRVNPFHEHLMEKRVMCQAGEIYDRYQDNRPGEAIPIILTRQWSQNPHLASTQFYRDKILPLCEGRCDFIENLTHGVVAHSPWADFQCGIFNPAQGDMMRVRHLDGKGSK